MRKIWQNFLLAFEKRIDNKPFRFGCLFGAGFLGLWFGTFMKTGLFECLGVERGVAKYLATATVGIPVFFALWYFRTRDVRQQIDKTQQQIDKAGEQINKAGEQINKTQEQIYQNQFNDAFENLTGDVQIKVEVGVKLLIKLSEETPAFNELIEIAFIERLKYGFSNEKKIKLTYGRNILTWLFENTNKEIVIQKTDLSNQDLSDVKLKNINLNYAAFFNSNLVRTVLQSSSLIGANFQGAALSDTDLQNSNLSDAVFQGVHLPGANLRGVNFSGADMRDTGLAYADLRGANLSGANLQGTSLLNTDLRFANLSGANFINAQILTDDNKTRRTKFNGANIKEAKFTREQLDYIEKNCMLAEDDISD